MPEHQDLDRPRKMRERVKRELDPALVIPAFSRVDSLRRLLNSLSAAVYPNETTLIISIDGGGSQEVADLAREFGWPHGEKQVIAREHNLGPHGHLLACGDLTEKYGSVVILEDDLFVSPQFYKFAKVALEFYSDNPKIAGIGLYSISLNAWVKQPFLPLPDRFDVFFLQAVSPWGQVWSEEKWTAFRSWLDTGNDERFDVPWLPKHLRRWDHTPDKYMSKYAVETDRYFVHPKTGLLTNFCEAGAHYKLSMNDLQVPLVLDDRDVVLCKIEDSRAVYDAWYEIQPWLLSSAHPALSDKTFCVDLFEAKDPSQVSAPYMLTVRPAKNPIVSFGLHLRPRELNVLFNVPGDAIVLARTEDVSQQRSKVRIGYREHYYSYSHLKVYQLATAIFAKAYGRARRMIATGMFR